MARNSDPVVGVFRSDGGINPGPDNSNHEYRYHGAPKPTSFIKK
ncbi:MAG TPA: hypothetical protein VJ437_08820 [Acidiferrobacterales bacterium]|nr:hypothetical protein [Acidiferrobacterales bacterium]